MTMLVTYPDLAHLTSWGSGCLTQAYSSLAPGMASWASWTQYRCTLTVQVYTDVKRFIYLGLVVAVLDPPPVVHDPEAGGHAGRAHLDKFSVRSLRKSAVNC